MRQLLIKTEDGKYALSSIGDAAVSMMDHVEEPPKHPLHLRFPPKRWKRFTAALIVGLILLSSSLLFEYQSLRQLSTQYSNLQEEHELMLDVLRQLLRLENSSLTQRYDVNDTVATSLVETWVIPISCINGTYPGFFDGAVIWYPFNDSIEATYYSITSPWGDNVAFYSIYNLVSNSTLKVEFLPLNWSQQQTYLTVEIWEDITMDDDRSSDASTSLNSSTVPFIYPTIFLRQVVWSMNVTNSSSYSVPLPSSGRFLIRVEAPSVENATNHYKINYAMVLQVENQGKNIPFFVDRQTEGSSMSYVMFTVGVFTLGVPNYYNP